MLYKNNSGFLLWDTCAALLLISVAIGLLFSNQAYLQAEKNYVDQRGHDYQELVNLSKEAWLKNNNRAVKEVNYHGIQICQEN
ncbi:hypothetical protein [Ligilactobacillus equi]|uniref:Uncharacterized protein n=1 Tax=Ligilactobacillus equi DPC 6820 TaxID=1392007 RepID=V7HYA5_9LACO|nr:hypothetical protein [Ligilactobacillus equi]ETA74006.1 hypothetical protein LEQ_0588c [Ligilactobacillus equi DPC 6820]